MCLVFIDFFFFQAEDGIRDIGVTGVQTCALPILKLRELQDETHGFVAFIPLAFHPDNTALSRVPKPTGYADLRNIAVSRLLLDNFEHIKAYWIMLTPSIAQIALRLGANDLDGTVVEETIDHDAGAKTSEFTPRDELERLI